MTEQLSPAPVTAAAAIARRKAPYLLISLLILALDQWTKWLIELHLPLHSAWPVIDNVFYITHVRNTGVAFGMMAERGSNGGAWLLIALGLVALVVVGHYFHHTPPTARRLLVALAMVLGGAVGNLLDRAASGAVTDFLGVYLGSYRWPDFNVADSAISIGLCLMVLDSLRRSPSPAAQEEAA